MHELEKLTFGSENLIDIANIITPLYSIVRTWLGWQLQTGTYCGKYTLSKDENGYDISFSFQYVHN